MEENKDLNVETADAIQVEPVVVIPAVEPSPEESAVPAE